MQTSRMYLLGALVILAAGVGYYMFTSDATLISNGQPPNPNNGTNGGGNGASEWTRNTDAASFYSVELPKSWNVTRSEYIEAEPAIVPRPWNSTLIARSPDWRTENRNDFDAPTHIAAGAAIEFYVSGRPMDSGASNLGMPIKPTSTKRAVTIGGVKGELLTYHEDDAPHHVEGRVLEVSLTYKNVFYTFRFAFNPATYPEGEQVFMGILGSVEFLR